MKPTRPTKAQLDKMKAAMGPMRNFFEEYGRIGGKAGAAKRWDHVSPKERTKGARKAALARWAKKARKKRG